MATTRVGDRLVRRALQRGGLAIYERGDVYRVFAQPRRENEAPVYTTRSFVAAERFVAEETATPSVRSTPRRD
jgi:hypothetical protein